jgi:DNA-binding sugar fermentation-stimulating protein
MKLIEGKFIQESKNRFLCIVDIDGISTECYIPSSCHLSNFIALEGRKVLLKENQNPESRTRFAVWAVRYRNSYIILNTSSANEIVYQSIKGRRFSFLGKRKRILKEHTESNYKCDIFVPETKTILEIKSIISIEEEAIFPTVYSERSLKQLQQIKSFLNNDYQVYYCFVALNPYVKKLKFAKETDFYRDFSECCKYGMNVLGYRLSVGKDITPHISGSLSFINDVFTTQQTF